MHPVFGVITYIPFQFPFVDFCYILYHSFRNENVFWVKKIPISDLCHLQIDDSKYYRCAPIIVYSWCGPC